MSWQQCGLLFLGIVVTCFIVAFIEIIWESRHDYYFGKAKPRKSDPK